MLHETPYYEIRIDVILFFLLSSAHFFFFLYFMKFFLTVCLFDVAIFMVWQMPFKPVSRLFAVCFLMFFSNFEFTAHLAHNTQQNITTTKNPTNIRSSTQTCIQIHISGERETNTTKTSRISP